MIIHSKHSGFVHGVRRMFDSGGSGPSETTQKSDVPDWAKPFAKEQLGAASSMVFQRDAAGNLTGMQPYQQYTGERTAQFTPLQQQAFQSAGQQGIAGQIGLATGLAGSSAQQALGAGAGFSPYQTGQFGAQAADYMSPYMQNVVDIQQREAARQAGIAGTQRAGEAVKAGAFGGGRQAVVEAEAGRNLAMQQGDIQARGLQSAYEQAQQMFNQEQQRAEQSRQYGAGLGLQGAQAALQGAGTLGALGGQQFGQQMDITQQQQALGSTQQQQMQRMMDQQYQDFMAQQQHPYEQMDWLTGQLRGIPMGSQSQVYQAQPSTTSQLVGLGTAAAGFAAAQGGMVPGYAGGGITGLLSDPQLQERQQMSSISALAKLAVEKEMMDRAQMRQGMQPQQPPAPQRTVAEEVASGLGALPVPDDLVSENMAGGGIVAFQAGGEARTPYSIPGMERDPRIAGLLAAREATPAEEEMRLLPAFWRALAEGKTVSQVRGMGDQPAAQAPTRAVDPRASASERDAAVMTSEAAKRAAARTSGIASAVPAGRGPAAGARAAPPAGSAPRAATGIAQAIPGMSEEEVEMAKLRKLSGSDEYEAQSRKSVEEANAERRAMAEADKRAFEEDVAARGVLGAEREKRLKGQEEKLAASEGKNLKMTLIEAGLAIASGRSPNALSNIADGAAAGLKGYQARLDRIEEGRAKIDDAMARLEDLRREEAISTGAEKRAYASQIRKAELEGKLAMTDVLKETYGTKSKQAETAVSAVFKRQQAAMDAQLKREQIQSNERVAGMYAGAKGASGGAGNKWTDLTAAQQSALRAKALKAWDDLGTVGQRRAIAQGVTQDAWVTDRVTALMGSAPAAPVNSGVASSQWGAMSVK